MKDREAVCEKVRAVGLIYQQSVEGDTRDPENKKTRSRREGIPRVKGDGGSRNGPKVEGLEHLAGIEPAYSGWKPDVITKLRQMQSGSGLCAEGL